MPRKAKSSKEPAPQTTTTPVPVPLTLVEVLALRSTLNLSTLRHDEAFEAHSWVLFYTRVDKESGQVYSGQYTEHGQFESPYGHEIEANKAFHEFVQGYDIAYRELSK